MRFCGNDFREFHHPIIIQNKRPIIQYLTTYLATDVFRCQDMSSTHFLSRWPSRRSPGVLHSLMTVFASRWPLMLRIKRDYAALLNASNRRASLSRSGRSTLRLGSWMTCPTIPLRPSSRNGPSRISSSRSETWMRKSGSIPISWESKAA